MENKIISSIFTPVCLCTVVFPTIALSSCSQQHMYSNLHALAPYLHYMDCDGYTTDTSILDELSENLSFDFGCSSVRSIADNGTPGDFFGRNFDYYYSEQTTFVVRMKADESKNRLASIALCNLPNLNEDRVLDDEKHGKFDKALEFLPCNALDGINEKGVVCNMNVCSKQDAGDYSHSTSETKERVWLPYVCRYILDNATSAQNAIDLLNEYDWYLDSEKNANNLHFMIADMQNTFIVELYDGLWHTKKVNDESNIDGDEPVMTNSYETMSEERLKESWINGGYIESDITPDPTLGKICNLNAKGTERYKILFDLYKSNKIKTFGDVLQALKKVYASQTYIDPLVPHMPSEDLDQHTLSDQVIFNEWINSNDEYFAKAKTSGYKYFYNNYHKIIQNHDRKNGKANDIWITNHTSIFQFSTKTMWLINEENYTNIFVFTF